MAEELKRCPFCGEEPVWFRDWYDSFSDYTVRCKSPDCGTVIMCRRTKRGVFNAWNRRKEKAP